MNEDPSVFGTDKKGKILIKRLKFLTWFLPSFCTSSSQVPLGFSPQQNTVRNGQSWNPALKHSRIRTKPRIRIRRLYRCNGTSARAGLLGSKMWVVHENLPIGQLTRVRTVDPHWGKWLKSSTGTVLTLTLTTIMSMQLLKHSSLQTTSRPHHHATPQAKLLHVKCTRLNTNLWTKKPKRVALATKY